MSLATGLGEGFVLLILTATALAFLAKRTRQPTVIAYLAAGILLGPVGLSIVGETEFTKLLSELGLVFLLFLIGLEINLEEIREILKPTVIIAVSQMVLTALVGFSIGVILGFSNSESLFIGAAFMFSSTALVVKLLTDKDEGSSLPERLDIGVLLIQDVAVVLLLALISTNATGMNSLAVRLLEIFAMIGLIGAISYASSRYFLPRLFKEISDNQHAFFIHGVAWAFLFITGAQYLNLSMEIGAFFAGLSMAQLPYSRELQERVRPLTDLFMAVFFINFGLNIAPGNLFSYLPEAVIASAVVMIGKFAILFGMIDLQKFTPETSFKASINMTQISEFSLIFGSIAVSQGMIGEDLVGFLSLVAIITMGVSSYMISFNHLIYSRIERWLERLESDQKKDVEIRELRDHAVVVGYDEVARNILPVVKDHYDQVVVIDRNPDNVKELARSDYEFIYGDFQHGEIKNAAGLSRAALVVSLAPSFEINREILEYVDGEPTLFLKSDDLERAGELYELGAHYVIVKNILTGEKMGDYIELYLEDRELFMEEVKSDNNKIIYGGSEDV